MRAGRVAVVLAAVCAATAACSALLDLEAPPVPDDGGGADTSMTTPDAPAPDDAASDAPVTTDGTAPSDAAVCLALDAGSPDGSSVGVTYNPLRDLAIEDDASTTSWTFFEPEAANMNLKAFQGGAFDGRYVYFAPSSSGWVGRYDTQLPFTDVAAWTGFNTATVTPAASGYAGAAFDGRYVYLVPNHATELDGSPFSGLVVRYDTQASFVSPAAWSVYDVSTLPGPDGGNPLTGFNGGVFDGHALYLVPYYNGVRLSRVARYAEPPADAAPADAGPDADAGKADATASDAAPPDAGPPLFSTAAQWSTFDMAVLDNVATGYAGAVFDGRYAYLVPSQDTAGLSGVVARYDTTGAFTTNGSWSFFDTTSIDTSSSGFMGGAFDGRYVYFVPHGRTAVSRYDTQNGPLARAAAWSTFDVSQVISAEAGTPEFAGAAFDGRFVYLVPIGFGVVTRYDTWSTFEAPCAWSTFDISTVNASASSYFGAVYDGHYLYFAPRGTVVARFATKNPPSMPALPAFSGSFY